MPVASVDRPPLHRFLHGRVHRLAVFSNLCALLASPALAQKLKIDTPLPELEARAARDSNDAVAHYNLALGYWSRKDWDRAQATLQRAFALDPRFAPISLALAYLPLASGQGGRIDVVSGGPGIKFVRFAPAADSVLERFNRFYRLAFMLDPLVDIRIVVAAESRGAYINNFLRAVYAYNDGRWSEAFEQFTRLLPDSSVTGYAGMQFEEILRYRALAATRLERYADAQRDFERLVARSVRREASDTLYREVLRTNEYRFLLAFAKQRAGDLNGAVAAYEEALAADLGLFPAAVRIAEIYESARQWEPAIAARRTAIHANPDDPSMQLDLGWTLAKAGRFAEAEAELAAAAERGPHDARAPYYLGLVRQQLDQDAAAKAAFEHFLRVAPSRFERQIADARHRLASLP